MSVEDVLSGKARWAVIVGDCLEILPTLPAYPFVLITDPPYGIDLGKPGPGRGRGGSHGLRFESYASYDDTYEAFVAEVVPALNVALGASVRGAVFTGPHVNEQKKADAIGGVYCPAGKGRHLWGFKTFLPVLLYGKAPELNLGAKFGTTLVSSETPDRTCNDHPVPKPIGWMTWLVQLASRRGDVILDPFAGSGTTGVAALRLGRRFIGIERDPKYAAIARERLAAESADSTPHAARAGQIPMFGATRNEASKCSAGNPT